MNGHAMTNSATSSTHSKGITMTRSKLVRRSALAAVSLLGVVGGSVGHMSAFMAQAGRLVICGGIPDHIAVSGVFFRGEVH